MRPGCTARPCISCKPIFSRGRLGGAVRWLCSARHRCMHTICKVLTNCTCVCVCCCAGLLFAAQEEAPRRIRWQAPHPSSGSSSSSRGEQLLSSSGTCAQGHAGTHAGMEHQSAQRRQQHVLSSVLHWRIGCPTPFAHAAASCLRVQLPLSSRNMHQSVLACADFFCSDLVCPDMYGLSCRERMTTC